MSTHRFFVPPPQIRDGEVCLRGTDVWHITKVLRLGMGAKVIVFDGRGELAGHRVTSLNTRIELRPLAMPTASICILPTTRGYGISIWLDIGDGVPSFEEVESGFGDKEDVGLAARERDARNAWGHDEAPLL